MMGRKREMFRDVMLIGIFVLLIFIVILLNFETAEAEDIDFEVKKEPIPIQPVAIVIKDETEAQNIEAAVDTMEEFKYRIEGVTEEDIDLMARVVMSEASVLPFEGKQAVAETIVNRVLSDEFPNTIKEVIEQPNAYSTADNGIPTPDCYNAVIFQLCYQSFPEDMFWFRTDYPHPFGYYYMHIGNTYFNTESFRE